MYLLNLGSGCVIMAECPFLSTYENEVECFKDCDLYEWKENGGVCPFKNLPDIKLQKLNDYEELEAADKDLIYIKDSYLEDKMV